MSILSQKAMSQNISVEQCVLRLLGFLSTLLSFIACQSQAQPFLSSLHANRHSPLYATYAAAMERSSFLLDKGYHFAFYDSTRPLSFLNESAGEWGFTFRMGGKIVSRPHEMSREVQISTSYPDLVLSSFSPFDGVEVRSAFLVYSSRVALHELVFENKGTQTLELEAASYVRSLKGAYGSVEQVGSLNGLLFAHREPPDRWVVEHGVPHVEKVRDVLVGSVRPDAVLAVPDFDPLEVFTASFHIVDSVSGVGLRKTIRLPPGGRQILRFVRAVTPADDDSLLVLKDVRAALQADVKKFLEANERLFSRIPEPSFEDEDHRLLYWNAFTLLRQCMLPPEGKCNFNYYVFSREPQWGWGHGGQVFHESLSMLAYMFMDSVSAMNSQRVFLERQHSDGYINYRTGPYLDETIPYENQLTTSAPWLSWINWEIYKKTKDRIFLEDAYVAGTRFYDWWLQNRDADGDGLCEWGGHGVLESVRDGKVAVWDEVGWPANFEALDLNCMLVSEARALMHMARELGLAADVKKWKIEIERRKDLINSTMWDEESGFYYHVEKTSHTFSFAQQDDLKRREIIGFLPLWAGVATKEQAAALISALKDSTKFWRPYGIPTLTADDPYYDPQGYWNGPIWVEWQYLVFSGLLQYGYVEEARQVARNVSDALIVQLKTNHWFWELYSPDSAWAGWHKSYIWTGLMARFMIDLAEYPE
ncbi:MAG: hypothetical protein HBSIN02_15800 [Bacteroidia bacterium]|nr:MAG: hypothetical protein HBSIN02_15800 [Bacteroidia bacterium]